MKGKDLCKVRAECVSVVDKSERERERERERGERCDPGFYPVDFKCDALHLLGQPPNHRQNIVVQVATSQGGRMRVNKVLLHILGEWHGCFLSMTDCLHTTLYSVLCVQYCIIGSLRVRRYRARFASKLRFHLRQHHNRNCIAQ